MTLDEWRNHKDFDELSREMQGDFSAYHMKMLADSDSGGFLKPKTQTAAQSLVDGLRAE
jgi:hypothetical protein